MAHFPVIVYGNSELFIEYFKAIVATLGTSHFKVLMHLAILLSGVTVIYSFIMKRDLMVMVKWFGLFYFVTYLIFMPTATVDVYDRLKGDLPVPNPIDRVPLGLAIMASYTSVVGDELTKAIETNFHMPDYLPYNQTGMVFASRLMEAAGQFEITDSQFDENMQEFVHQCIFYDLLLNKYTANELAAAPDLWQFVTERASPARAFVFDGEVTTCALGASKLGNAWKKAIDSVMSQYSQRLFPTLSKAAAKNKIITYLPLSYGYLTKLSKSANEIVQQNIMANAIQRGVVRMGAKLDASAALESYSFSRGQEQQRLTMRTLADMSAHWLPLMKNVFEAIMYGSFIFIVLLSVFPFGLMILKNYLYTLLWIQIWAPLYAIINLTVSYYAKVQSIAAVDGALSLKSMAGLIQINSDISTLAGYLTLSVPFLSAGLVKGMAGTFTQLAQYIGGVTQSAAGAGAGEAVTGNMSFGNTSLENHNAFNTSANHFDTSAKYSSGMMTEQIAGGSSVTMMQDGSVVMNTQNALSNLGSSVNLAGSIRQAASSQAEKASTYGDSKNHAYTEAMSSFVRQASDLSKHVGKSNADGESWNLSMNAATSNALNNIHRATERYAHDHGLSFAQAERALTAAYVEARGGLSVLDSGGSIGGKAEYDKSSSQDHRESASNARDFIRDSGYSQSVDTVERAAHDHSLRASNEKGQRMVDSMAASFDKAESARHEMSQSYQVAKSYRDVASKTQEEGSNFNTNASQAFAEWLMNQPGENGGHMTPREYERMAQHEPQKAQQYARQFAEQYANTLAVNSSKDLLGSHAEVRSSYERGHFGSHDRTKIDSHHRSGQSEVVREGESVGIRRDMTIDTSLKNQTESKISERQHQVSDGKQHVNQEGEKVMTENQRLANHAIPKHKPEASGFKYQVPTEEGA